MNFPKLTDAIDKNIYKIDEDIYTDEDFEKMSLDDLETLKLRINKKLSGIKALLRKYGTGKSQETSEWFRSKKSAESINIRMLSYIKILMKKKRVAEKSLADVYMAKAKLILEPQEHELILNSAKKEIEKREAV